jgi:hypothetical protein
VRKRPTKLKVLTLNGPIEIAAVSGCDPVSGRFCCPLKEALGLAGCGGVTPELAERRCFTATLSLSYDACARIARKEENLNKLDAEFRTLHPAKQRQSIDSRFPNIRDLSSVGEFRRPSILATLNTLKDRGNIHQGGLCLRNRQEWRDDRVAGIKGKSG